MRYMVVECTTIENYLKSSLIGQSLEVNTKFQTETQAKTKNASRITPPISDLFTHTITTDLITLLNKWLFSHSKTFSIECRVWKEKKKNLEIMNL